MKNVAEKMSKGTKGALLAIILVIIITLVVKGGSYKKSAPLEMSPEPLVQESAPNKTKHSTTTKPAVLPVDTRSYT